MPIPHSALRTPHSTLASHSPRVLVIGLDGATYDLLVPLAEAGAMPNLAALLREAALHALRSTEPYTTPVAWSSFLTGCDAQTHGILDYRYLDHARGELLLNHAGRIACPTLLDEVAAGGGQVVSLSLPMTHPAPAGVAGIVIGGLDCPSGDAALRAQPQFAQRLRAAGIGYSLETIWKRKPRSHQELAAGVARTIAEFDDRVAAARIADEMTDWRLMIVQFQTLDSLQHRCWHLLSQAAGLRDAAFACHSREALRAMEALDRCVGQLIELAERRRAAVVVLGDHGFGPFREKICVNEVLRRSGLQRLTSRTAAWQHRAARTAWKLRKWLHRRAGGGSTAGIRRPLEALAPVDWRRTAALAVHGELAALVYLNDAQRFGRGPLATSRQRDQAEADALAAFREARHPVTEEPLFDHAYATRGLIGCDPIARGWPDVVAIPAPGFHTRTKFDTARRLLCDDPTLTGTHRRETVLMIHAPGLACTVPLRGVQSTRPVAEMRDVAPTILALLGQPPGTQMTGRSLLAGAGHLADPSAGTRRAQRETHLAACLDGRPAAPQESCLELSGREHRVVEDRLRDLGYLE